MELFGHPVSLLTTLVVIGYLASAGYPLTAVVVAGVALFLMREWSNGYAHSEDRRVYLDTVAADARFDPMQSVDIQVANKTLVHHNPPANQDTHETNLLTYPPSDSTLYEMCG
jgi:predicted phosphohydrolase